MARDIVTRARKPPPAPSVHALITITPSSSAPRDLHNLQRCGTVGSRPSLEDRSQPVGDLAFLREYALVRLARLPMASTIRSCQRFFAVGDNGDAVQRPNRRLFSVMSWYSWSQIRVHGPLPLPPHPPRTRPAPEVKPDLRPSRISS
jgi:hypothetical protein